MPVSEPHTYNRDELIRDNLSFICQIAGKHTGRVLEWGRDEELSVALVAFNSAIDTFCFQKSDNFQAFAALIIRRRLTDYYRAGSRRREKEYPAGDMIHELRDEQMARPGYLERVLAQERRQEILAFTEEMSNLGIKLDDLVLQAPKHDALRERLLLVVKAVVSSSQLFQAIAASGRLPLDKLRQLSGVSQAVLSKRRKYLLALIHVYAHSSEYPFISTYLNLGGEMQ